MQIKVQAMSKFYLASIS